MVFDGWNKNIYNYVCSIYLNNFKFYCKDDGIRGFIIDKICLFCVFFLYNLDYIYLRLIFLWILVINCKILKEFNDYCKVMF